MRGELSRHCIVGVVGFASRLSFLASFPLKQDSEESGDVLGYLLRHLEKGDMLIFYCGLEGWDFKSEPALYLMGYFEVLTAGKPADFGDEETHRLFQNNFHVRHQRVFERQKAELVLVKGSEQSRLLTNAVRISVMGLDRTGKPLKVLSPKMQEIFGSFSGRLSFQRSPTRWVDPAYVTRAVDFMRSLD